MLDQETLAEIAQSLLPIAYSAGDIIEDLASKGVKVLRKMDGSPVTAADQQAENAILESVEKLALGFPIVGEELVSDGGAPNLNSGDTYWLVDALDGTKEFIKGTGEYTVNIGLIENKKPVLGVVYAPAKGVLYYGCGDSAFKNENREKTVSIAARSVPEQGIDVTASRSHGDSAKVEALLSGVTVNGFIGSGSSLKFCLIAEGKADIYPRYGRTCEWDTAAAHAILNAAGGHVVREDTRKELAYGKVSGGFYNPEFIALSEELLVSQFNLS